MPRAQQSSGDSGPASDVREQPVYVTGIPEGCHVVFPAVSKPLFSGGFYFSDDGWRNANLDAVKNSVAAARRTDLLLKHKFGA